MKNNEQKIDLLDVLEIALSRCKEQSKFYRKIAYQSEYKDETIQRIVNLGIAYEDVANYLAEIIRAEVEKQQSLVAQATIGDPAVAGQTIAKLSPNEQQEQERTPSPAVNSVDGNEHK